MNFENQLKDHGLKSTKQRLLLLKVLTEAENPLNADTILERMKQSLKDCNLSTVYRNMEIMIKCDMIHEVAIEQKMHYTMAKEAHGHYIQCVHCKEMTRIEGCPLGEYERYLEKMTGYKIIKHKVELFGVCKKCSNNC